MTTTYKIKTFRYDTGLIRTDEFPTTGEATRHFRYLANHLLADYGAGHRLRVWDTSIAGRNTLYDSPPGDIELRFDHRRGLAGAIDIERREEVRARVEATVETVDPPAPEPAPNNVPELPPFLDEPPAIDVQELIDAARILPPAVRSPMHTVQTYAELAAMPWTEVPIIREERDEGRIVPELGVSPRAIREFRVNAFVPKRGLGQMLGDTLVIDTRCYNGFTVRHMIPINAITSVVTLHEKKVQIGLRRGAAPRDFVFTDDECAFVFQHAVEMQLWWASRVV